MDTEAEFREFVLGQSRGLRQLAYAVTGDWVHADDLVQGTFERAYARWSRVRRADDPGAYVRTILLNLSASERRRSWHRFERLTAVPPEHAGPVDDAARAEGDIDLARALEGLTPKQRAVLVLRYVEDRSLREVANILGIAEGTVKRQTHDAVKRLRTEMTRLNDPARGVPHA